MDAVRVIPISEFKAAGSAILAAVGQNRQPGRVTRRGIPLADIVPSRLPKPGTHWLGCMVGTGQIIGDIVAPVCDPQDWQALR